MFSENQLFSYGRYEGGLNSKVVHNVRFIGETVEIFALPRTVREQNARKVRALLAVKKFFKMRVHARDGGHPQITLHALSVDYLGL